MEFSSSEIFAPMELKKSKSLGAVLELPAKQQRQSSPFAIKTGQMS